MHKLIAMRGIVGFRRTPQGGFGNRLLSYLSLRMIARRLQAPYFSVNSADRALVSGIHKPLTVPLRFRDWVELPKGDALAEDFIQRLSGLFGEQKTIVLKPPLLGEVYARYADIEPSSFIQHNFRLCRAHKAQSRPVTHLVFHLRGTDFAQWNSDAILDLDYYRNAYEILTSQLGDHDFRIATDDPNHPALAALTRFLERKGSLISGSGCSAPFECDFAAMAGADYLIAAPSTFSLSAALLGNPRVVQSARWVDNRIARGEAFWTQLRRNELVGYRSAGLV